MNLTRVSLYRHEMEVCAKLTLDLCRLTADLGGIAASDILSCAPQLFGELAIAIYGAPPQIVTGELPKFNISIDSFGEVP